MKIHIYKTSVTRKTDVKRLRPLLNQLGRWNFDLEDCDRVLRIESSYDITNQAIDLLNKNGFMCMEL